MKVGVLGCGNVGAPLVSLIEQQRDSIRARTGINLEVKAVAVRTLSRERTVEIDASLLTTDSHGLVTDPEVDLVVETIGGIEPARELILEALKASKPVVTANKELLANFGPELFAAADGSGVDLLFEAAVGGGIPIIRPLRESLAAENITRVMGIVNGTTNFILTRMSEEGLDYADALAEAQSLGYAERDPTADVEGYDAGAKAAIIATIAFGGRVVAGDVYHEGISGITEVDIEFADRLGFAIKLLAIAERFDDGSVAVRVHPAMVPHTHPLASVRDSFNAVFIEGEAVGELMFYGRGAGGYPTASAVLGDVVDAAANLVKGTHASIGSFGRCDLRSLDDLTSAFYVNLNVEDSPGVLAAVAGAFGRHGVSIHSMEQVSLADSAAGTAKLIFITHQAREADLRVTLGEIRQLETVSSVGSVLRVIGAEGQQR